MIFVGKIKVFITSQLLVFTIFVEIENLIQFQKHK